MRPLPTQDEDEVALTEELRALLRPRSVWPLVLLVVLALALGVLALVASRTGLWGAEGRAGGVEAPPARMSHFSGATDG